MNELNITSIIAFITIAEAVTQRCCYEKVFWKYAANLQENTHGEVWFQYSCFATFLRNTSGWLLLQLSLLKLLLLSLLLVLLLLFSLSLHTYIQAYIHTRKWVLKFEFKPPTISHERVCSSGLINSLNAKLSSQISIN